MGVRFAVLIGVFTIAFGALVFKIYDLQLANGEYYLARAVSQEEASRLLGARRGTVYFTDKRGDLFAAAINKDFPIVFAAPKDIKDPLEAAAQLSPILGESADELRKKISNPKESYRKLASKVKPETARAIDALKLKGIYTTTESSRFYPYRNLASHLLGFVGPDAEGTGRSGHYGLEEFYEKKLSGARGEAASGNGTFSAQGRDLILTIDPNIQIEAERILSEVIKRRGAAGGGVIVEEPATGKVLALAGMPNFDPNNYQKSEFGDFVNPMTQKIYEPGSVFKVITMAAGIDFGKITPETTYVDTGRLTLNGRTIQNYNLKTHGAYGKVTMKNVIEHSINTGAVYAQREIGRERFTEYVKRFGFGEKTGIGLPGELKGDIRRLNPKERDIAFATASYGQGVAVTPLEVTNAVAAIANGGKLMRPYLDASLEPEAARRVIKGSTARQVTEMMISAVDKAEVASISGYSLAGKTGTAFIPDFKNGGYTDRVINTYVGFGPTKDPKFIILIKLDDPEGAPVAALTVVPAFRDLAQFILNYYNIPPDRLEGAKPLE